MAPLDEFESKLKEIVQAKRLSASKMAKLQEIALHSMEDDTQIVSILYRTHKSLPPPAKVSSLYVFDALSRAARQQATKLGLSGDIYSKKGNCATFLLKVEGVLEGLFQDMTQVGSPEAKEKTKKILDIWVKGSTFPPAILARLTDVVKDGEKEPEVKPVAPSDPRAAATSHTPTSPAVVAQTPTPTPTIDPQAALLALLTQAVSAAGAPGQTITNISNAASPQMDSQLALLQQLAQTAQLGNGAAPHAAPPPLLPSYTTTNPPSLSHLDKNISSSRSPPSFQERQRGPGHDRYDIPPDQSRGLDDYRNDHGRGGHHTGFRSRGRGGGWSSRDDRDRSSRDRERSPPRRPRQSRSKSPPNSNWQGAGRRDTRPYSPPRRPSLVPRDGPKAVVGGKDEFGRDIRPESPEGEKISPPDAVTTQPVAAVRPQNLESRALSAVPQAPRKHETLSPSIAASTSSATDAAKKGPSQLGMDSFDITSFDFTLPASWESLGKKWQVTHGILPSTEQLMEFVMATMATSTGGGVRPVEPTQQQWAGNGFQGQSWQGGKGLAKSSGAQSYPRVGRDVQHGRDRWKEDDPGTEAIVLGGSDHPDETPGVASYQADPSEDRGGATGGRMQRVGGRWMFVRDPGAAFS